MCCQLRILTVRDHGRIVHVDLTVAEEASFLPSGIEIWGSAPVVGAVIPVDCAEESEAEPVQKLSDDLWPIVPGYECWASG
jgi:hypothetical protein